MSVEFACPSWFRRRLQFLVNRLAGPIPVALGFRLQLHWCIAPTVDGASWNSFAYLWRVILGRL